MSTNTERTRASAFGLIKDGDQSGSFPVGERDGERLESDALIAELAPDLVSLIPEPPEAARSVRPRPPTPSERAELVIEDLSLQLDNPYLASSLVPPPKRPFPMRRMVAIASGMLAAAAIGAVIQLSVLRSNASTHENAGAAGIAAPVPAAAVAAAAPQKPAAQPVIAEAPVLAPAPAPMAVEPAALEASPAPAVTKVASTPAVTAPAVTAPAVTAPAVRIARVVPPAPPEPAASVAEAATPAPVVPVTEPAAALPEYPTREQVNAGFEAVRSALAECAAGRAGTVEIKASIASSGRVAHALIGGDFSGTPEGSCMARAVRGAQFPAFAQPRLKVSYPFAL